MKFPVQIFQLSVKPSVKICSYSQSVISHKSVRNYSVQLTGLISYSLLEDVFEKLR